MEATLRKRFADYRALMRRNVEEARPVLESLLNGRIVITPNEDTGMFKVRIPLTTRGIFEGICGPTGMASPAGFEPALPA